MNQVAEQERWTRSGVRLRTVGRTAGQWNWVFVPGGPGLGSESLRGLAETARVPGTTWLVDLPGEGSNRDRPEVPADPYALWPGVLVEAAQALDDVIMVGHSTGGMFMLSVPELEEHLAGMVLISSAPHAGWRAAFGRYAQDNAIAEVDAAAAEYVAHPDDASLRALTLAAAPWNFTEGGLAAGRALLADLPYNNDATSWADAHFDDTYKSLWAPQTIPTLIVSGEQDNVVDQSLWQAESAFSRPNVEHRWIEGAAHFPWLENPDAVRAAFSGLTDRLSVLSRGRSA